MHRIWIQPTGKVFKSVTNPRLPTNRTNVAKCALSNVVKIVRRKHPQSFGYLRQCDAQEFLRVIIDELHNEMLSRRGSIPQKTSNVSLPRDLRYVCV